MPELTKVLTEEDLRAPGRMSQLDLSPYLELLSTVKQQGVGGIVTLGEGESQRTEKRRFSLASKQQGYRLIWRSSPPRQLRFVLAEEGQPAPGGRRRQAPTGQPDDQVVIDAVMTDDVAAVTETTPNVEEVPEPAPQTKNGRRRRKTG